ncbi:MAG: tripartite tricarboxylate transporter permease [Oscillospiraceae bacterium]|nr:tripartite tricarboxylate transporter permease [Oscillospiraceae bacterium]
MFANLFATQSIIALLIGVIGGTFIGALPGLTATMAVALLVPVTFGMEPTAALIMLSSVYVASVYGGAIPAILLHTPGSPASAATAMDGYALTQQGKGLHAVGAATVASVTGGLVGGVILLFLTPPLARLGLRFNAPEFFLIAILGLSVIGSLASDNPLKGITAGAFGLGIAMVGIDMIYGVPRFTYQITRLEAGIQLVPALIGLFSISQVMLLAETFGKKEEKERVPVDLSGSFWPPLPELIRNIPNLIRSTMVGTIVGIIPGPGADIGAWLAYNEAKRFSKNRDQFGKGAIEGIYASESGNNAAVAGAFIPLLALGIPGGAVTAVLLGGLTIQGLTPGHTLFTAHAAVTYAMLFSFMIASVLMGIVGWLVAKRLVKLASVPNVYLIPVITVLSVVGTFAINRSMFDVGVMAVFGFIGYFMRKTGFATAPIVLAIVLGPMAEGGFQRSLLMARGENLFTFFLGRPFSLPLVLLIALSLATPIFMSQMAKRRAAKAAAAAVKEDEETKG